MRVIDLLNKIANGEELPNKIKYEGITWKLNKMNNTYDDGTRCFFEDYIDKNYVITDVLNDEVEVIEEDKKIDYIYHCCMIPSSEETKFLIQNINDLADKINEIIDKLEN